VTVDVELHESLVEIFTQAVMKGAALPEARRDNVQEASTFSSKGEEILCTCDITGSTYSGPCQSSADPERHDSQMMKLVRLAVMRGLDGRDNGFQAAVETAVGRLLDAIANGLTVPGDVSAEQAEAIFEQPRSGACSCLGIRSTSSSSRRRRSGWLPCGKSTAWSARDQ
jgi:hypothetical protein